MTKARLDSVEERVTKLETDNTATTSALRELKSGFDKLNDTVEDQMGKLIQALTGVNRIDVTTLHKVVGIFGVVIVGLVAIIVFLLTGQLPAFLPKA